MALVIPSALNISGVSQLAGEVPLFIADFTTFITVEDGGSLGFSNDGGDGNPNYHEHLDLAGDFGADYTFMRLSKLH